MKLVVSACLLGKACRYDAKSKAHPKAEALAARWIESGGTVVDVCPEELGGLGTPRPPCDLAGGDGVDFWKGTAQVVPRADRQCFSEGFRRGAEKALQYAKGCDQALLKARSPSCGCGETWIDGKLQTGDGVFAARLRSMGIPLATEEDL